MTRASRRFDNRLKRFEARLMFALSLSAFAVVAQAWQPTTTNDTPQSTAATPDQALQKNTEARRIQAVRVTEEIKIDGLLNESASCSRPRCSK